MIRNQTYKHKSELTDGHKLYNKHNSTCPHCSRKLSSVPCLQRHLKIHLVEEERTKFSCPFDQCSKKYYEKSGLSRHVQDVHSGSFTSYPCSLCDSTFVSKHTRDAHVVAIHTGEKSFSCKDCPAKFATVAGLWSHRFTHTEERRYKCEICSTRLKQRSSLLRHMKRVHPSGEGIRFFCSTCQKSYSTKNTLTMHTRIHHRGLDQDGGGSQFSCYFCKMEFCDRATVELHLRSHTQEKPFSCSEDYCQYSSSCGSNLRRHMKHHTRSADHMALAPLKTWPCYFCNKPLTQRSHLQIHLRIHTLENPYVCLLCSKSFGSKTGLNKHILSHTKEKPYNCTQCRMFFPRRTDLRRHVSTHMPITFIL